MFVHERLEYNQKELRRCLLLMKRCLLVAL